MLIDIPEGTTLKHLTFMYIRLLRKNHNKSQTAKILGIGDRTLYGYEKEMKTWLSPEQEAKRVKDGKKAVILRKLRALAEASGLDCCYSVGALSRYTEIPEKELYNYDETSGLLVELEEEALLSMSDYGKNPTVTPLGGKVVWDD